MAKSQIPVPRMFYSVPELAQACGLSRQKMYEMVNAGEVPHKVIGSRKLIPVDVAQSWAENLPDGAA